MKTAGTVMMTVLVVGVWALALTLCPAAAAGSLTPPGAPGASMKTMQEVYDKAASAEPRTPISSIPFTISQSGSYYLTGNLGPAAQNTNGITIQTGVSRVTIDLNGFSLVGAGKTTGTSGNGINIQTAVSEFRVCNGSIVRWRGAGVMVTNATDGAFENLQCSDNGGSGINAETGSGCIITGCQAKLNGNHGFELGNAGRTESSLATSNSYAGFKLYGDCTAQNVTATGNQFGLYLMSSQNVVRACTVNESSNMGILLTSASYGNLIEENTIDNRDSGTNGAIRIESSSNSVQNNTIATANLGIFATQYSSGNIIDNNAIARASTGLLIHGSNNILHNNLTLNCTTPLLVVGTHQLDCIISSIPYAIQAPGNYCLSGPLALGTTTGDGITITASDVTLDLNGYALNGPGHTGSYCGIRIVGSVTNIHVRNGAVKNWPLYGIYASDANSTSGIYESLMLTNNGDTGLYLQGKRNHIEHVISYYNAEEGISVLWHNDIRYCQ